jgi:excisionase family DNA binding protein
VNNINSIAIDAGILTRFEVARMLDFEPDTIRRWSYSGKIPAHKIGNRIVFLREEIMEWIKTK